MTDNLDRYIKDSKVVTPDSGEYRRLNRVLLKERMLSVGPRRRRRHRTLGIFVVLVTVLLMSGQISQLGSDSFETRRAREFQPWSGDSVTVYENVFRGGSVNLPEDFTEADIDEYQRSFAAGEGRIIKAFGTSYGGRTAWIKMVTRNINGRENTGGMEPDDPPSEDPENFMHFLQEHYKDLIVKTRTTPPSGQTHLMVDGVLIEFDFWTFEYPGYGEVIHYDGYPVEKK